MSEAWQWGLCPILPLGRGIFDWEGGCVRCGAGWGTRLALDANQSGRWITEKNLRAIAALQSWASERGKTLLELAFAWLLADPIVGTVIAGASSPEQIAQNAAASSWQLTTEDCDEVTGILDAHPIDEIRTYYSVAGYFGEQVEVVQG